MQNNSAVNTTSSSNFAITSWGESIFQPWNRAGWCRRNVLASAQNFSRDTDNPVSGFSWFSLSPSGKYRNSTSIMPRQPITNTVQFINHLSSKRCYTVLDAASVVVSTTQKSEATSTKYRAIEKHLLSYRNEHTEGTCRVLISNKSSYAQSY